MPFSDPFALDVTIARAADLSDTCPDCPDPALCQSEGGCLAPAENPPSDPALCWDAL